MDRDQLLAGLRERILAFATLRVSRDGAEDLAQEVLVVLQNKYAHVMEMSELVPLAFQVLRFKMLDAHRKSLRRGEYNQESVDDLPQTASRPVAGCHGSTQASGTPLQFCRSWDRWAGLRDGCSGGIKEYPTDISHRGSQSKRICTDMEDRWFLYTATAMAQKRNRPEFLKNCRLATATDSSF
jgi:hypothetical protein